jgi:integrase
MKGSRLLSYTEGQQFAQAFKGKYASRDRALFILGVKRGLRISELLSLTLGHLVQHGRIAGLATVRRRHMKKKVGGRTVPRALGHRNVNSTVACLGFMEEDIDEAVLAL